MIFVIIATCFLFCFVITLSLRCWDYRCEPPRPAGTAHLLPCSFEETNGYPGGLSRAVTEYARLEFRKEVRACNSSAEMSLNALKLRGSLDVSSTLVTVVSWDRVHGWGKFSWKSAVPCKGHNLRKIVTNTEGRKPNSLRGERMLVL